MNFKCLSNKYTRILYYETISLNITSKNTTFIPTRPFLFNIHVLIFVIPIYFSIIFLATDRSTWPSVPWTICYIFCWILYYFLAVHEPIDKFFTTKNPWTLFFFLCFLKYESFSNCQQSYNRNIGYFGFFFFFFLHNIWSSLVEINWQDFF
jgi:CDP-diglyceride synthetase